MINKKFIENITCAFIIIYSIAQLIYSITYIIDLSGYSGNSLIRPIFNTLLLVSFLVVAVACFSSPHRKPLFITLSIICVILFIYSTISNINSIREFMRISDQLQLSLSLTVSRYLAFFNLPLTFLLILSIFCITADRYSEER